ncbi:MAG: dual specificity protein phosphatase [Candidatus Thorarchaeota archaeon]
MTTFLNQELGFNVKTKLYKVTENLYISRIVGPNDFEMMIEEGITAVVNLETDQDFEPDSRLRYLFEGVMDWRPIPEDSLKRIFAFMAEEIARGTVLVHCYSGRSRSGGVIVGWLMLENPDWTCDDAMKFIHRVRKYDLLRESRRAS